MGKDKEHLLTVQDKRGQGVVSSWVKHCYHELCVACLTKVKTKNTCSQSRTRGAGGMSSWVKHCYNERPYVLLVLSDQGKDNNVLAKYCHMRDPMYVLLV